MKNLLLRVAILLPLASLGMSVFAETLTDRLSLSNDFRFRQEHIDTTNDTSLPNNRQRFRARLGLDYKVNDKVTGGLHLASGSTDPVSTNQSLEGGFTTKSIGIDRAYVQWSPLDNFEILAGKQKNPFYTIHDSELIWDGDLRPEGISTSYSCGCGDWIFSASLAKFVVE